MAVLLPAGLDPLLYFAGFALFRLVDIFKPLASVLVDRNVLLSGHHAG